MTVAIDEPVPEPLRRCLRRAVVELARAERRRRFPPALHLGVPGGSEVAFATGAEPIDHALRIDTVEAMLRRLGRTLGPPLAWLTRPGPLDPEDADLQWFAAVRGAAVELDLQLRFVVVCRQAWQDPVSGVGQEWPRPPRSRR